MALTLGDNFSYQGAKPLDARLKYETVAAMKAVADATMYEGCLAYCSGTDKTYQWKSGNTVDETTGKWREFTSGGGGGGGTSYTAGDGIDITNDVISTEKSEEGAIDEIIDRYPTGGELVSIVNAFNKGDLYSTDERMIGQWIDGKPLYQKVVDLGTISNNVDKTVAVSGSSVMTVINIYGVLISPNSAISFPLPYAHDKNISYQIAIRFSQSAGVEIFSRDNTGITSGSQAYAVLQYTKTTDSAIAIGSENEYSTDEKIIGTWIDGKPLYQKTVNIGSLPNSGTKEIAHGITSLDKVISSGGIAVNSSYNLTIPRISSNSAYNIYLLAVTATDIQVNAPFNASDYTGYVTLQYTKTT